MSAAVTAALLILALSAVSATAVERPWYVTGSIGVLQRADNSFSTNFTNNAGTVGPGTNTDTFDPGPVLAVGVGYRLPWNLRVEGELGFATFTTASVSPLSTNGAFPGLNGQRQDRQSGGAHDLFTATVNAFYDLPIHGPFVPYLGAGFGLAHEVIDDAHFANFNQFGNDTTNPVVLGEVGLTVRATEAWEVVPAYRFEHVFGSRKATFDDHILKLGVRYRS